MKTPLLLRALLWLAAALASGPALAAAYVFPGTMPTGCSGSGGSYTCGALSLGNSDTITLGAPLPATVNVNGNFNAGNRAFINTSGAASNLAINVTGSVSVGNQGQINGSLTATGALTLGNSTTVASCVRSSSSATIRLGNGANAGAVCCGAPGSCTSSCVVNNSGSAMPALCAGSPSPGTPGRFNAFDTGTAAGSVTGNIRTKIAGTAFNVAVVAVNTAGTGLATGFTGNVRVEILDGSNNSGALTSSTGCRNSWVPAAGTAASTLSFAASDAGRKTIALTADNAWRDARVRISYPATGAATVVGCSGDNLAIRPDRFGNVEGRDTDFQTAGTVRLLNNTASTGGLVHKAGQPFTVQALAQNSAGTLTANYSGTPTLAPATACCGQTPGTATLSSSNVSGGVITATATYSEAGSFVLRLEDSSFAAVDAGDGSTAAERTVTTLVPATVGRFVPDHFDIATPNAPRLLTFNSSTCATRSFTYLGQSFGYVTALEPQATVLARNAAGTTTVNYPDAKLNTLTIGQGFTHSHATPALTANTTAPAIAANGNGTAQVRARASDRLTMVRPSTTPLAPFSTSITLAWTATDSSEGSNGAITTPTPLAIALPFDSGNTFRFGLLKLGSAYGSELINLAVPLDLQYWNGNSFVTNAEDQCTTLPASALALGPYRGNLSACETAPGAGSMAFTNGRGVLRMLPPGSGNAGSADVRINLGTTASGQHCSAIGASATPAATANMPWLHGKSGAATTYTVDPSARISFGQYRSPLIHLREMY